MILALNGRKRSGKNTVAELIAERCENVEQVAYADKLKDSCAALFGIDRSELDRLKNAEDVHLMLADEDGADHFSFEMMTLNFRQIIQRYGTEAHRDIFGSDFWVRQTLDPIEDGPDKLIIITDCRFPNEAMAVKERGGLVVRVLRHQTDDHGDEHSSEQNIDHLVDHYINNSASLFNLEMHVENLLRSLEKKMDLVRKEGYVRP